MGWDHRAECRVSRAPRHALARRLTGDVQVQVLRLVQVMQFLRRGAADLLHSQRGRRAAPRAGGRGGPVWRPLVLPLHGGGRGPLGGHKHGPARPPKHPPAPRAGARNSERGVALRGRRAPAEPGRRRPRRSWRSGRAHRACPAPSGGRRGTRAPQPWLQRLLPLPAPPSPPPGARSPLALPTRQCCLGQLGLPGVTARVHHGRGRCCPGTRVQRAAAPGDPRRAVPWSFIHKKGPTTLLAACRLRPFIGQRVVTSLGRGLSTGRYPVTP